jgi:Probable zinc-ribbon domain
MTDEQTELYLTCLDFRRGFPFTVGEQKFFAERGLSRPKRCADSRLRRVSSGHDRDRRDRLDAFQGTR